MDKPSLQFSFQKLEKNSIFAFIGLCLVSFMEKPSLQFSSQKLEKNSIFAFIQYVKESNFHNIAISYLGGGKWKEERESYFFFLQGNLTKLPCNFFYKIG